MIGVIAEPAEHDVVREFFELFKTPWEFYRPGRRYEVALCAADLPLQADADLVVVYCGRRTHFDDERSTLLCAQPGIPNVLSFHEDSIPIYRNTVCFTGTRNSLLTLEASKECAAYLARNGASWFARVGYDLFAEVRALLTAGQPSAQAHLPTLDLHIAFLRQLIVGCGITVAEIPPVPEGFRFIVCLTHDVDHPSIREHKWDHTMLGFLYRALFGSLQNLVCGRISLRTLLTNWAAALKLPFVHLGIAKDFWRDFEEQYLALEYGLASTFFVIPFKNNPGLGMEGKAPRLRAATYGARDIADIISKLAAAGREVGLHGIDAWCDSEKGRLELEEVRQLTAASQIGVRMHWLYYGPQSPALLEKAGADYDSTVGYNEAVGYRAGTGQAYKPLDAERLLELPLHVMDTALFYGARMGLSRGEAKPILKQMIENAGRFGGCLTINWHDRSLAPERLWDASYLELLQELREQGAWFATAKHVVSWFRKRRSAVFEPDSLTPSAACVSLAPGDRKGVPGLRLRFHQGHTFGSFIEQDSGGMVDSPISENAGAVVPSEAGK